MANKVLYGIKNVYYAVATDDGTGTLTYATPVAIPGARSISLSASGDSVNWAADNTTYFSVNGLDGYEGDLTVAMLPDTFRTAVLGETLTAEGIYAETNTQTPKEFALLFQFEGDENAVRHCFYRCTASRPDVASSTVDGSPEPNEESITIRALPRISDGLVKGKCLYDATSGSAYQSWFTSVQEPTL